ncbi:1886_t:CDS:1 [Ambispora leptoticha]|uniref:1886_t:CDS:1 n=1 Tax=Ambispora leptoticha TaxID=144679 RepID=A0A9N9AR95_9GLOM|nr:1886_t:CDS:1 [Ambispora leptoticha]
MFVKSYKHNQENLQNLTQTAENVSFIIDFWSSRAKYEYLRITTTRVTANFEIKDVMLENKYIPSSHASRVITDEVYKYIEAWNLKYYIISISTNNESNMVVTFLLLNQKDEYDKIKHLLYTAHTFQLVIGKGLTPAEILVVLN